MANTQKVHQKNVGKSFYLYPLKQKIKYYVNRKYIKTFLVLQANISKFNESTLLKADSSSQYISPDGSSQTRRWYLLPPIHTRYINI